MENLGITEKEFRIIKEVDKNLNITQNNTVARGDKLSEFVHFIHPMLHFVNTK